MGSPLYEYETPWLQQVVTFSLELQHVFAQELGKKVYCDLVNIVSKFIKQEYKRDRISYLLKLKPSKYVCR